MELSLSMKLRIAASVGIGVMLIGILAWPLVEPSEPLGVVRAGNLDLGGAVALVGLAFLTGLVGYFVSWPYGREIGVLAAPSGLAIWAVRSGDMAALMQLNPTVAQRQVVFAGLKWEPLFWLIVVAAGFVGVLLPSKIFSRPVQLGAKKAISDSKTSKYLNIAIALVGSVLIAHFCIGIFARDVRIFDSKLGSVVAQPAVGQIVFAVLVSFGLVAFIVKSYLKVGYIWPIIAVAFVTAYAISTYVKPSVLQHLAQSLPAVFFPNASVSILPVQMVAFGTLGSITGYWLAVRYAYWREHEMD